MTGKPNQITRANAGGLRLLSIRSAFPRRSVLSLASHAMNIIRFASILALLFVAQSAHATRQSSDPLIWKGETVYPERGPSIWKAFPDKQEPKFDMDTTANWKGYRAKWEIKDDLLLLISLEGRIDGNSVPPRRNPSWRKEGRSGMRTSKTRT